MEYIIYCIYFFAISIIAFSFVKLRISVALYIFYLILVPYLEFRISGFPLSYNLVNVILLAGFFYEFRVKRKRNVNFKAIIPFLFLYGSLLFLGLLANDTPLDVQFNYWRISFMKTCILSFIVWNIAVFDPVFIKYIKWVLIVSISIAGVYAIFLTQLDGFNPYTSFLAQYFGKSDVADTYASKAISRLSFSNAGKIQSTMLHPMTWTLVLCFSFIIFTAIYFKTKNRFYWLILGFIAFNILISGVRTGIAALTIGFVYFLLRYRQFKIILFSLSLIVIMAFVVQSNDDLSSLFSSFTDVSGHGNDVKGSSISMRIDQLQGAIDEIRNSPIVGKGYGWSTYYMTRFEVHPILLAFESLLFVVLCNHGVIGIIIWSVFCFLLLRLHRKYLKAPLDVFLLDSLMIVYVAYAIGTGEYGYIQFFGIYYFFLFAYLYRDQRKNNNNKIVLQHIIQKNT